MTVKQKLSGWGRVPNVEMNVDRPEKIALLKNKKKNLLARGLGRSYGDASLNSRGNVLLMERLDRCLEFDDSTGILKAEAGLSIADLLEIFVPRGWFIPVTPGTQFATLGGCVACDVHGKNHHCEGSFGDHVEEIELLQADGKLVKCSPKKKINIFWATIGGLGLTGIITSVTIKLRPIPSAYMRVQHHVAKNLDEVMKLLDNPKNDDHYSVAWIDCLASGKDLGRSVVMTGHHAMESELPDKIKHPFQFKKRFTFSVPYELPSWVLSPRSVKTFNSLYYTYQGSKKEPFITDYERFFYPLDSIHHWNLIYGKKGFIQYQFVLPMEGASEGLRIILEQLAASQRGSFLAVLKQLGAQNKGMLSFPTEGYTLALDLAYDEKLLPLLKKLDEILVKHKGRIYLAKDARLDKTNFENMYSSYSKWLKIKKDVDPHNKFRSDLSKRLGIDKRVEEAS